MNRLFFNSKLIFRKFTSNPLYPLVSLAGLVIGFTACLFVAIWTYNELSYDVHYPKADRTYRISVEINNDETGFHWDFARSLLGWLMYMPNELAGVESMVRLSRWMEGVARYEEIIAPEEIFSADSTVLDIFNIHLLEGNPDECLSAPRQVIVSESIAKKYFGTNDPMNKTLYLYCSRCKDQEPFRVTGVFKDFPENSHVHLNILATREKPKEPTWWAYYYLTLKENIHPDDILENFKAFASKYVKEKELVTYTPHLFKISDIHLKSDKDRELEHNGSFLQLKVMAGLALFVLLITLFNYFNLRYVTLLRDLRSYQILTFAGAKRGSLFALSFIESVIYGIIALIISGLLVAVLQPAFNGFIGKTISLDTTRLIAYISGLSGLLFLITLFVGLLPLIIWKGSKHIQDLVKSQFESESIASRGIQSGLLRTLVGVQYLAAFILVIAVIVMNGQLTLFLDNTLGQGKEKLICLNKIPVQVINKYDVFREELLKSPLIKDITASMENPGYEIRDMMGFELQGGETEADKKLIYVSPVADNFFSFYDIPLVAGSNFPPFMGNDSIPENFIINETGAAYLGLSPEYAVGKPFHLIHDYTSKEFGRIVGVVKDFQPSSMNHEIKPYVYFQKSYWLFSGQVRYDTTHTEESLAHMRSTWDKIYPGFPFNYVFVDNLYKDIYQKEFQLRKMSMLLCVLAIIIAAMGLFAITAISYRTRTKEIGIRKVNGARQLGLIQWLVKDILLIVAGAIVLGIPISYYLSGLWLENYTNAYNVSALIYVLAGFVIFTIALITVAWQTWIAASQNPVKALKYE